MIVDLSYLSFIPIMHDHPNAKSYFSHTNRPFSVLPNIKLELVETIIAYINSSLQRVPTHKRLKGSVILTDKSKLKAQENAFFSWVNAPNERHKNTTEECRNNFRTLD